MLNHGTHFEQVPLESLRKILKDKTPGAKKTPEDRAEEPADAVENSSGTKQTKGGE